MNEETTLFKARYAVETLIKVLFIRSMCAGTLKTFCTVQGIVREMVSVQCPIQAPREGGAASAQHRGP